MKKYWFFLLSMIAVVNGFFYFHPLYSIKSERYQTVLNKCFAVKMSLVELRQLLNFFLPVNVGTNDHFAFKDSNTMPRQRDSVGKVVRFFEEYDRLKYILKERFYDIYTFFLRDQLSEKRLYEKIDQCTDQFENKLLLYLYYNFSAEVYIDLICIMNKIWDDIEECYSNEENTNDQLSYIVFSKNIVEKIESSYKEYFNNRFGFTLFPKPKKTIKII